MLRTDRLLASCLAAALLLAGASFADETPTPKLAASEPAQRAALQTEFMKTRLDLSDAQVAKVSAINLKYAEQMQPILRGTDAPLATKMAEARRIGQAKDAEMQGTLSSEQYQSYLAAKEEMRQQMEQKLAEPARGGPAAP